MARRPFLNSSRRWWGLLVCAPLLVGLAAPVGASAAATTAASGTYRNPLRPQVPGDGTVQSCADPTVFRSQSAGDPNWYMFCTADPLNARPGADGKLVSHPVPMQKSRDLVHWTYVGDALSTRPAWAEPTAGLFAPEVTYSTTFHKYYLFFTVTDVTDAASPEPGCNSDSAIGVATSTTPTGPWTSAAAPVIAPRRGGAGCNFLWNFDPDVLGNVVKTRSYLYYGSYYGGIQARPLRLSATDASAPEPATQITIPNRYEGTDVVWRNGYYYLFASAANCCNGPLTGYSVFAGRSTKPLGPFVDREGNSLLAGRVGGTPVISMNGNRWVGTGHNSVFRDFSGQWWTVYHAVDRFDPYFAGSVGFTKRPPLLDPVDWVNGWPTVRAGRWASTATMPAPAAQPGTTTAYRPHPVAPVRPGSLVRSASDEFTGATLRPRWSWVRPPPTTQYGVGGGDFRFRTQTADLYVDNNTASVLTEATPTGDYMVTTRVHLNLPPAGCGGIPSCYNFVQAGLVIYGDDDNFIKLAHVSIYETRQTEFAKEVAPVPAGYPRYGNSVVGPPAAWTYLRIVRRGITPQQAGGDTEQYTAFTSQDGSHWVRGGTWNHKLGSTAKIGLVSMGGAGFLAKFDYVRVNRIG